MLFCEYLHKVHKFWYSYLLLVVSINENHCSKEHSSYNCTQIKREIDFTTHSEIHWIFFHPSFSLFYNRTLAVLLTRFVSAKRNIQIQYFPMNPHKFFFSFFQYASSSLFGFCEIFFISFFSLFAFYYWNKLLAVCHYLSHILIYS